MHKKSSSTLDLSKVQWTETKVVHRTLKCKVGRLRYYFTIKQLITTTAFPKMQKLPFPLSRLSRSVCAFLLLLSIQVSLCNPTYGRVCAERERIFVSSKVVPGARWWCTCRTWQTELQSMLAFVSTESRKVASLDIKDISDLRINHCTHLQWANFAAHIFLPTGQRCVRGFANRGTWSHRIFETDLVCSDSHKCEKNYKLLSDNSKTVLCLKSPHWIGAISSAFPTRKYLI